jgi:hypothetical protein
MIIYLTINYKRVNKKNKTKGKIFSYKTKIMIDFNI